MVGVEAGVHASVFRERHRDVAVVEGDRNPEALPERGRNPAKVRHGHGEDDHGVRPLCLDQVLQMPLPARSYPAADRLACELVEAALLRVHLHPAQVAIPFEPRECAAHGLVRLALSERWVASYSPPRCLDRAPAVGRHHEVDPRLVHPLPELPPRRRAAVTEVEVDRRRDGEDLRRPHRG